ncbi:MAG: methionine ABC transporter ATP-binding protein [Desulfovibrionales bacterium]|nr:methionine ABC transporter ATP-binding protein [Desulfovibrionales bacterium]
MIEFQKVHKTYHVQGREIKAVQSTDLHVQRGEIFGLIGHSGAGKSTLLRLINRLEEPSGGRIMVNGIEVTALDALGLRNFRRKVGMIFQHFNLLASKTVAENIAMPMKLAGDQKGSAISHRVKELLHRVGLSDQAMKYPSQLSGGQKQRVGIARSLATGPDILLCDEATSALDPQTTGQVLHLLAEINRELGLTIVLITHEMDVIRRVCDRVGVIDDGIIVELGAVTDVFLHPQHPTTRRFVQEMDEDSQGSDQDWQQVQGSIVRLTFLGASTYAPVLGRVARETGADYSILAGRIGRIKDQPCGQLTVALSGSDEQIKSVFEQIQGAGVTLEVIRS